jgi:DNA-binding NarL/FixJ family response regulator
MYIINVLLYEDQELIKQCMVDSLKKDTDLFVLDPVSSPGNVTTACTQHQVDIVIIDSNFSAVTALEIVTSLREINRKIKTVILGKHFSEEMACLAFRAKATAFITKNISFELFGILLKIVHERGGFYCPELALSLGHEQYDDLSKLKEPNIRKIGRLTRKELEIIQYYTRGFSTNEIASTLKTAVKTVRNHKNNIMKKYDVHDHSSIMKLGFLFGFSLD